AVRNRVSEAPHSVRVEYETTAFVKLRNAIARSHLAAISGNAVSGRGVANTREPLPRGCARLPRVRQGKEGVDGSNPSEDLNVSTHARGARGARGEASHMLTFWRAGFGGDRPVTRVAQPCVSRSTRAHS